MENRIRTSQLARTVAAQHNILPQLALNLVTSAKQDLEINDGWLTPKQAAEVEALVAQDLRG